MSFDYEYQMINPAENWLLSQGLTTKREFITPWGICDLVGCSMKEESVKQRLVLGQRKPIGPQIRIMILSRIPDRSEGRSIRLSKLLSEFSDFLDEDRMSFELDRLEKDKFVFKTRGGSFQKLNGWAPLHEKIVALELKLSRINDALHQAVSHLDFVDESFVGLPSETAHRLLVSRKILEFVHAGIGILSVGSKSCKVILEPNSAIKAHKNKIVQMHCVERFWRTRIKDN